VAVRPDTLWFHGGPAIEDWGAIRWDRQRGTADPNAEGPGMYFTTDKDEARGYGRHLYVATMMRGFRLIPRRKVTPIVLRKLYELASPDDRQVFLSNWNVQQWPATPRQVDLALAHYDKQRQSNLETFVELYHDLFRYDDRAFVRAMVALGYDGHIVGRDPRRRHLVLYNPDAMIITKA
jgi:hypothetical protein